MVVLAEDRSLFQWHRCRKWWRADMQCPFHPGEPIYDDDDEDDDEKVPVEVPIPLPLPIPPGKKIDEVEEEVTEEAGKLVDAIVPFVPKFKVLSSPGDPGHFATEGDFNKARDAARVAVKAAAQAASKALRVRSTSGSASRIRKQRGAKSKERVRQTREQNKTSSGLVKTGGAKSHIATMLAAGTALAASLKSPSGGGPRSGPTAGAETASGAIAESAIIRRLQELSPAGGPRRREQGEAVKEAERIVRPPPNIVPPREREGQEVQSGSRPISTRSISAFDETGFSISAQRIAIAVGIGVGAVVIGGAVIAGGRGGGFHRPAVLRPGTISRAY